MSFLPEKQKKVKWDSPRKSSHSVSFARDAISLMCTGQRTLRSLFEKCFYVMFWRDSHEEKLEVDASRDVFLFAPQVKKVWVFRGN